MDYTPEQIEEIFFHETPVKLKPAKRKDRYKCHCGGNIIRSEYYLVCEKCGQTSDEMKEFINTPTEPRKNNAYIRRVHFLRILKRVLNKRRTEIEIPSDMLDDVKIKLDGSTINALKKKVKNYRVNCYYLMEKLINKPYISLTQEQQEHITTVYVKISRIWDSVLTEKEKIGRHNAPNNYFLLKQICLYLGYTSQARKIHDLLGKPIQAKHTLIWANIKKYLK